MNIWRGVFFFYGAANSSGAGECVEHTERGRERDTKQPHQQKEDLHQELSTGAMCTAPCLLFIILFASITCVAGVFNVKKSAIGADPKLKTSISAKLNIKQAF